MVSLEKPYFMENQDWYYYDEEEGVLKLTKNATKKAKESYLEFYSELERFSIDDPE